MQISRLKEFQNLATMSMDVFLMFIFPLNIVVAPHGSLFKALPSLLFNVVPVYRTIISILFNRLSCPIPCTTS